MSKLARAVDILNDHGIKELAIRSQSWLRWRMKKVILLDNITTHEINDVETKFHTITRKEHPLFKDLIGEREAIAELLTHIEPDELFYDIGADVGLFPCFVGQQIQEGNTIAFEPHPKNTSRLKENLELNQVNAEVAEFALGKEDDNANLQIEESGEVSVGSHQLTIKVENKAISVRVRRGDRIAGKDYPEPAVLKVDVGGAEYQVLKGLKQTLQNSCRIVICEIHEDNLNRFERSPDAIKALLTKAGFNINQISMRDASSHDIFAIK